MKKLLLSILPLFLLCSCSTYVSRYFYSYEQTDNSAKQSVQKNELYAGYNQYFEDDLIKLHLDCEPMGIRFYFLNKTNKYLNIIWDSTRVYSGYLNKFVVFSHSNKAQDNINDSTTSEFINKNVLAEKKVLEIPYVIKPSIILPNNTLMDEIQFNKNEYILPYQISNNDTLKEKSNSVIGKSIKLLLPIKVEGKTINYTFVFTVKDFQILSKQ
ncbi:MAG: hypothetical protein P4L35_14245 [Ignavibacteriaceae bacterium]|nr:hypothetical protein [Ignavibacteriaceae bacterium]